VSCSRDGSAARSFAARKEIIVANNEFDIKDQAANYKDQAANYGRRAVEAIDSRRGTAADSIETAASTIRNRADELPGGDNVRGYARQAADTLGATADYVRQHDLSDMAGDLTSFVKAHPAQALIGAAVIGFLAGRAARSS
jgi:hypothetical protein